MTPTLSDQAASLIAGLPNDARELTRTQVDALQAIEARALTAIARSSKFQAAIADCARERGCGDQPVADYLTVQELIAWTESTAVLVDAERAAHALNQWQVDSGLFALLGIEPPELVVATRTDLAGRIELVIPDAA